MSPYPHVATDTDFGQIRPADFEATYRQELPAYQDEHFDDAPNTRALAGVLAVYLVVMLGIIVIAKFIVTGNWL